MRPWSSASTVPFHPLFKRWLIVVPQTHAPSISPASQAATMSAGAMIRRLIVVRSRPAFAMTARAM